MNRFLERRVFTELTAYASAMGVALDCLADECSLEQLTAARAACDELDAADEASAQLRHLIETRKSS